MKALFRARHLSLILAWLLAASTLAASLERSIDVTRSTIRIHVGKSGVFSAAGHEHWVRAPIADGRIEEGSSPRISFRVEARELKIEEDQSLSAEKQAEVQRTMQTQVLESERYSEITFRSISIKETGTDTWEVHGDLTLHGQTNPITTEVHKQQSVYVGHCHLKQTDFGIRPVRVGGGMVKVKDELDIEFSIAAGQ
jgi:YceI-like domain